MGLQNGLSLVIRVNTKNLRNLYVFNENGLSGPSEKTSKSASRWLRIEIRRDIGIKAGLGAGWEPTWGQLGPTWAFLWGS